MTIAPNTHHRSSASLLKSTVSSTQPAAPHLPQSNKHAERAVKTAKKLLRNTKDPHMALLSYRSTPLAWCGLSPAELATYGKTNPIKYPTDNISASSAVAVPPRFVQCKQRDETKKEE